VISSFLIAQSPVPSGQAVTDRLAARVDFIFISTILSPMKKRLLFLIICCLAASACSISPRVGVESGYPGLRPYEKPYWINGERYVPLLHADGYSEKGLASWYGDEEQGKPTSSGEIFDMYKMTAAHKTLPLGSTVKVTNRTNGKETVVRINDRGPFVEDRIIDLSYQAAKELGIIGCGVAPVEIEVLSPGSSVLAGDKDSMSDKTFTIQVAAFSDRETALAISDRLKREYEYTDIEEARTDRGIIYRVHAGRFRSKEEAEAAKPGMERLGYNDAFVVAEK
jgi:rare lipoprotein A